MKISNGVEMLDLTANLSFGADLIHPTLLWDEEAAILVDGGLPGLLPQIAEGMAKAGVSLKQLTKIIITHQDMDHISGIPSLLKASSYPIEVLAHEEERPYLQTERPPIRMTQLGAQLSSLPEDQREQARLRYEGLKASYPSNRIQVDRTLADGELLPDCGGITVIFAPGHTPGHICLYHEPSKTLIAGDALRVQGSALVKPPARYTSDPSMAAESLRKLACYNIEAVICYHGGLYEGRASRRIAELAEEL
ncbi:MAG: MBL fold metallo-hydrolase [bacterium]